MPALLQDGEGQPIDIQTKSRMDGTYSCSYTPVKAIKHTIAVVWGGVNIPHSPYRVGREAESWPAQKPSLGVERAHPHGPGEVKWFEGQHARDSPKELYNDVDSVFYGSKSGRP